MRQFTDPGYDKLEQKLAPDVAGFLRTIRLNGERSNADQVSPVGARSVYQITPSTRARIIKANGFDPWSSPENAVRGAAVVASDAMRWAKGDPTAAAGYYHAGGNTEAWGKKTREYMQRTSKDMPQSVELVDAGGYVPSFARKGPEKVQLVDAGGYIPSFARSKLKSKPETYSPVSDSNFENFAAGGGKFLVDTGRGLYQLGAEALNAISPSLVSNKTVQQLRKEADATAKRDAPLMNTKAGAAGNATGVVLSSLPMLAVPGANTYLGASLIGAASGAMAPVGTNDSRLRNIGIGAGSAAGGLLLGRTLVGGAKAIKAAAQPFYGKGQQQIVNNMVRKFVANPQAAELAAARAPKVPGYRPTLAEATQDPGIAQLQRSLFSANQDIANTLTTRDMENLAALKGSLSHIAGDDATRSAAVTARANAASPFYAQADVAQVPGDDVLASLLKRPSLQAAVGRAERLAADNGESLVLSADGPNGQPVFSGKGLHYLKQALDDMLDNPGATGIGKNEQGALTNNRAALLDWMDQNVPGYGQARQTFSSMSEPVNKMDVGQALYEKLTPALDDHVAQPAVRAANFAEALRKGDQLARKTTGLKNATLQKVLGKDHATVNQVAEALARRSSAQSLGKAVGSNTAQNLSGQHLVGTLSDSLQEAIPLLRLLNGMSAGESLARPINWALKGQDPSIQSKLAQVLLEGYNPALLAAPRQNPLLANSHLLTGPAAFAMPRMAMGLLSSESE